MISQFMSSSPASGSGLTAQNLEPASGSVSPSLSAPSPLGFSLSKVNTKKNYFKILLFIDIAPGHPGGLMEMYKVNVVFMPANTAFN